MAMPTLANRATCLERRKSMSILVRGVTLDFFGYFFFQLNKRVAAVMLFAIAPRSAFDIFFA